MTIFELWLGSSVRSPTIIQFFCVLNLEMKVILNDGYALCVTVQIYLFRPYQYRSLARHLTCSDLDVRIKSEN